MKHSSIEIKFNPWKQEISLNFEFGKLTNLHDTETKLFSLYLKKITLIHKGFFLISFCHLIQTFRMFLTKSCVKQNSNNSLHCINVRSVREKDKQI